MLSEDLKQQSDSGETNVHALLTQNGPGKDTTINSKFSGLL